MNRLLRLFWILALGWTLASAGCGREDAGTPPVAAPQADPNSGRVRIDPVDHPAAPGSALGSLLPTSSLSLLFSWVETDDQQSTLRFAQFHGGRWGATREIAAGDDWFVNWADFPAMAQDGNGRLYAHWLQREGEGTYAYGIHVVHSDDNGLSWSDPVTPHADGTQTEHGFVSYFQDQAGSMNMAWLDGRNMAGGHGESGHGSGAMTLRAGRLDGSSVSEVELDAMTCDCCQTDAARTPDGAVVAYRDRSEDEIRDIFIARQVGGRWFPPTVVAEDRWEIAACPVNGPAVAVREGRVAVAWFTLAGGQPMVKLAVSPDGGARFDAPLRIDGGDALGRVDLAWLADDSLMVTWLEDRGEEQAMVRLARVLDGRLTDRLDVGSTSTVRSSGFPRVAAIGHRMWITWRHMGEGEEGLRLAEINLDPGRSETGP